MSLLSHCTTISELFRQRVVDSGPQAALYFKRDGQFHHLTWDELWREVAIFAALLAERGVRRGDRVVQVSENRREWVRTDLALQLLGAWHVPIHAPLTGEQIAWQIRDCGARVVLLSGISQTQKLAGKSAELSDVLVYLSYDEVSDTIGGRPVGFLPREMAQATSPLTELPHLAPAEVATILYTSGTTGEPKGVLLTQGNLVSNAVTTAAINQRDDLAAGVHGGEKRALNFLPLSHIFARTCDLYGWLVEGSQLALAESRETVLADAAALKPTFLNGVPYFFDKVYRLLCQRGVEQQPGALRELLGGAVVKCCSGGAALPDHLYDYYHAQGVPLLQGYGLSETSPVVTMSTYLHHRRGASGRAIPQVEIRIADDGEVLTKGPHVMLGYYQRPDATAEVLHDGWFSTGDYGRLDEGGYLYITGRKKEIIVTLGGKNVAPAFLEGLLTQDPLMAQALVVGDERNYLVALIVPAGEALRAEIAARGIAVASAEEALTHPDILALYQQRINERLQEVSPFEQVRKFVLLPRAFSIETGELTAKLSLRRKVIENNFREEIAALYSTPTPR